MTHRERGGPPNLSPPFGKYLCLCMCVCHMVLWTEGVLLNDVYFQIVLKPDTASHTLLCGDVSPADHAVKHYPFVSVWQKSFLLLFLCPVTPLYNLPSSFEHLFKSQQYFREKPLTNTISYRQLDLMCLKEGSHCME